MVLKLTICSEILYFYVLYFRSNSSYLKYISLPHQLSISSPSFITHNFTFLPAPMLTQLVRWQLVGLTPWSSDWWRQSRPTAPSWTSWWGCSRRPRWWRRKWSPTGGEEDVLVIDHWHQFYRYLFEFLFNANRQVSVSFIGRRLVLWCPNTKARITSTYHRSLETPATDNMKPKEIIEEKKQQQQINSISKSSSFDTSTFYEKAVTTASLMGKIRT